MKNTLHSIFFSERKISALERIHLLVSLMSPAEKALWFASATVFVFASFSMLYSLTNHFTIEVPAKGGTIHEGIIGTPRFANPVLAVSDADRDVVALTYSGLMRSLPDNSITPDLAEEYSVSGDGTVYTFNIKPNAVWSDGEPVTAADVEFTIQTIQNPLIKSPKRASFEGVTVTVVNDKKLTLTLKRPYAYFLEMTTIGILPKHIWKDVNTDEFPFNEKNISPVGTGPFIVNNVIRGKSGTPTEINLVRNEQFVLGEPYLDSIQLTVFQNEKSADEALANGTIDALSNIDPATKQPLETKNEVTEATLGRIFGVFFNQNANAALLDLSVRQALSLSVNRSALIKNVMNGFATPNSLPIQGFETEYKDGDPQTILTKGGWLKNDDGILVKKNKKETINLTFTLSIPNIPELINTAKYLERTWGALGAKVTIKVFEPSDLAQNVIKNRKYDALLFGIATGKDPDLYAFWHSSQRNDPGANIALYTNPKADKLLESMRATVDVKERAAKTADLIAEINRDIPAIFLYSPHFFYALPKSIQGEMLGTITVPSDRFANVYAWYTETDNIFPFF